MTTTTEQVALDRIGQIAIRVADIGRAVRFYRDTLGMRFLFEVPNLVLSPHIAGATKETAHRAAHIAAEEVGRYARGEDLLVAGLDFSNRTGRLSRRPASGRSSQLGSGPRSSARTKGWFLAAREASVVAVIRLEGRCDVEPPRRRGRGCADGR